MQIKLSHLCIRTSYFSRCVCSLFFASVQTITQTSERGTEDKVKLGKPTVVFC
jgi:hypothetical protein